MLPGKRKGDIIMAFGFRKEVYEKLFCMTVSEGSLEAQLVDLFWVKPSELFCVFELPQDYCEPERWNFVYTVSSLYKQNANSVYKKIRLRECGSVIPFVRGLAKKAFCKLITIRSRTLFWQHPVVKVDLWLYVEDEHIVQLILSQSSF
jgi:hypothetical protein